MRADLRKAPRNEKAHLEPRGPGLWPAQPRRTLPAAAKVRAARACRHSALQPGPAFHPRLVVMLKEPHPGRVKTRLGAGIGPTRAAWWFRHQTAQLVRNLSADPRWQTVLAVSPDREGLASRVWPRGVARVAQGRGDLGARMGRLFRQLPPGPVVIIGGDIPGIGRAQVAAAFAALGRAQAVLGPAPDGGYWLIGLRRTGAVPAGLFRDVRWSTAHARADTEATLSGLRIACLQELSDIDTAEDLRRWQQEAMQRQARARAGGPRDGPGQSC